MKVIAYTDWPDIRPSMEEQVTYMLTIPRVCSVANCPDGVGLYITKHKHAGQPLGHLMIRCTTHQIRFEIFNSVTLKGE